MSFAPPVVSRQVSVTPLRIALRTLLLSSATITGIVGQRVKRDMDVTGNIFPYIAVSKASAVPLNTHTSSGFNALMDLRCIAVGATANADAVADEIFRLVLDTAWTIAGYDLLDAAWVADIGKSYVTDGKAFYESGHRFRFLARKQ